MLSHYKINSFKHGNIDKKGFKAYQRIVNKMKQEYDTSKHEKDICINRHIYYHQLK